MNFNINETQSMLISSAREVLSNKYDLKLINKRIDTKSDYLPGWKELQQQGFMGMLAKESNGGYGLSFHEFSLIMEVWGTYLCSGPIIENSIAGVLALQKYNETKFSEIIKKITRNEYVITTPLSNQFYEKGNILTNFHCVYGQKTINLYYWDEDDWHEYQIKIIGEDPLADLAVLEVIGLTRKVPYLKFAEDGDIYSGSEVFALGHPMGMAWSLSKGIISSTERYARHPFVKAVQTDAAINKGNSGGPLLNAAGELIGINVATREGADGLGFAIPVDTIKKVLESLGLKYHPKTGPKRIKLN